MEVISKHTRIVFREHLVAWTLSTIADLFDAEDVELVDVPETALPQGQRRALVERYYASVDWASSAEVRKILRAYEHILHKLEEPDSSLVDEADRLRERQKLLNFLRRDG